MRIRIAILQKRLATFKLTRHHRQPFLQFNRNLKKTTDLVPTPTEPPEPEAPINPGQATNALNLKTGILDVQLGLPILNRIRGE